MSKVHQRVELLANVLTIVVALALGGVLIQRYFSPVSVVKEQGRIHPTVGAKITALNDVNWAGQSKTLILALQTGCHFCNESAPFYKKIIESVQSKSVKLVAVFPSSIEESRIHLIDLGLSKMEVRESPLKSLQVSGTPTLILTNDKGEITDYWVGKLTADKETEVIDKLNF